MKRSLLALALMTSMIGFSTIAVEAQTKKETIKKVEPSKKDAATGGIEIYKGKAGMRFRIVDAEGKIVAMPIPNKHWETREEVIAAIEELKHTLNNAKPKDVKE